MGKKVVAGIFVPEPVLLGVNGIDTKAKASKFLKDGGSIDGVPDDLLKAAILANASYPGEPREGKRFILDSDPGDGINNREQRRKADKTYAVTDTATGKRYILKTPTFQPDEYMGEQLAETIGQMAGRPMSRIRIASQVEMKAGVGRNRTPRPTASILVENFGDAVDAPSIRNGYDFPNNRNKDADEIMSFIDSMIGNPDRHPGNYLWAGEEVLPIDHGVFGARRMDGRREHQELIPQAVEVYAQRYPTIIKRIAQFDEDQIKEITESLRFQWAMANGGVLPDNAKNTVENLAKNLLKLAERGRSI